MQLMQYVGLGPVYCSMTYCSTRHTPLPPPHKINYAAATRVHIMTLLNMSTIVVSHEIQPIAYIALCSGSN